MIHCNIFFNNTSACRKIKVLDNWKAFLGFLEEKERKVIKYKKKILY